MKISYIIPVYNEAKNINLVVKRLYESMPKGYGYEIIFVNDGSRDGTVEILSEYAQKDAHFKFIDFKANSGQTAALSAGIEASTGDVLIPLDGDMENDPRDALTLLHKLDEGYDVVSGWRKDRWKNSLFMRKIPSYLANKLISLITGVHLHDYGCTLKAYRRQVIADVPLYGEMHRFVPAYASWQGARVTETPVSYAPRKFGKSKYGISRTFRVILDLIVLRFLDRYMDRPIHFFGGIGFFSILLGFISGGFAILLRLYGISFIETPLPTLTVFLWGVGLLLINMGVIAEMLMRIYYESTGKKPYQIRQKVNF